MRNTDLEVSTHKMPGGIPCTDCGYFLLDLKYNLEPLPFILFSPPVLGKFFRLFYYCFFFILFFFKTLTCYLPLTIRSSRQLGQIPIRALERAKIFDVLLNTSVKK